MAVRVDTMDQNVIKVYVHLIYILSFNYQGMVIYISIYFFTFISNSYCDDVLWH